MTGKQLSETVNEDKNEIQQHELGGGNAAQYFEEYGNAASMRNIVGQLLKFSKGDWLVGQDNEELDPKTHLVACMDEMQIGWVKWVDGKPEENIMGRIIDGYQPKKRKELGDTDESEWEVDNDGKPRDPWQFNNLIIMRPPGLDAIEEEDLYTFVTSSRGGINAVGELCKAYGKQMRLRPNDYPIIELGVNSYNHPNKEYGRIKIPLLTVVGWELKTPPEKIAHQPPAKAPAKEPEKAPAKGRKTRAA